MAGGYLLYSSPNLSSTYIKIPDKYFESQIIKLVQNILTTLRNDSIESIDPIKTVIDQHFYKLYSLTQEEINIIEENVRS